MSTGSKEFEDGFREALRADPADDDTRRVYADWLDEQGQKNRAEYLRLDLRIRALDPSDPMHGELTRRFERLSRAVTSEWREEVTAPAPVRVAEPKVRAAVQRDPSLPLPPRPSPDRPLDDGRPAVDPTMKTPMDSFASRLRSIDREDLSRFWRGIVRGLMFLVILAAIGVLAVDEIRWQMKDDNFITGRQRGCSR